MIWTGFALVLFVAGAVTEYLPTESPSDCLMMKRKMGREWTNNKNKNTRYSCLPATLVVKDYGDGQLYAFVYVEINGQKN